MIRSLGSSLLAKAGTGSLTRKKDETRITKPEIPGKAATGTAQRELVQETDIQPVAPGSEKVIRSAPGIESASLPGVAARNVPIVAGMGMAATPGASAPGVAGNGMFAGGGGASAPASAPGQAARQATSVSGGGQVLGAVAQSRVNRAAEAAQAAEASKYQAGRVPLFSASMPNLGIFGGRVSASGEGEAQSITGVGSGGGSNEWQPTAGQYLSGAVGKAINAVGQKLGNVLPEKNISEKLQTWGGSKSVAAAGKGSIEKAVNSISSALRSVTQKAQNTINKLRSKFSW